MRDYDDLVRRVEGLPGEGVQSRVLAEVEGYPMFGIAVKGDPRRPTVLLMAGSHGDEPAGVEAAFALLQGGFERFLPMFNFAVLPCLNPYGYVHDTRHNVQGVDLNWAHERNDVPEVQAFRNFVRGRRFEFALDLHEDWESPGYYVYERCRRGAPVGPEVVRRVEPVCKLNTEPFIDGNQAENGIILLDPEREEAQRGPGIPTVIYYHHTDHWLTSESPTSLPLDTRVQTHLIALETMIQAHL